MPSVSKPTSCTTCGLGIAATHDYETCEGVGSFVRFHCHRQFNLNREGVWVEKHPCEYVPEPVDNRPLEVRRTEFIQSVARANETDADAIENDSYLLVQAWIRMAQKLL